MLVEPEVLVENVPVLEDATNNNVNPVHNQNLEPYNNRDNFFDEIANEDGINHLAMDLQNDEAARLGVPREAEQIREWAIECSIPQAHLDKLLQILRVRLLPEMPRSSKTLLKTNSMPFEILEIRDEDRNPKGSYVYIGIQAGLKTCVNPTLHPNRIIHLQINVDGLPIFNSSKVQFWPILCKIF